MVDFAGGHPSTEDAAAVIAALDEQLGRGAGTEVECHPGVQYRHILVAPASWAAADCVPPPDLPRKPRFWPPGAPAPTIPSPHRPSVRYGPRVSVRVVFGWRRAFTKNK